MRTAIVLFTRDLRVHDHPALAAAVGSAERVVPLFVCDRAILSSSFAAPNRLRVLIDSLGDLDRSLRERGGALVTRRGEVVEEVVRLAREVDAQTVHATADVSAYAQRRERQLTEALAEERRDLELHPGITVVAPGEVTPSGGGDNYEVFTPYFRAWDDVRLRPVEPPPEHLRLPADLDRGRLPALAELTDREPAEDLPEGGETAARRRLDTFLTDEVDRYEREADRLAATTSQLSTHLHLGTVSPREIVDRADRRRTGVGPFVRQLAWRDFHHQVLAAHPDHAWQPHRDRRDDWNDDEDAVEAWTQGRTGYPVVDAAMRQLRATGWMHNRARMIVASFLTKHLYVDWRIGARHFLDHLVDGDIANNQMNWQWVAGTGTDSRPNRMFNPTRQAHRFDPDGAYVRRWVPELGDVPAGDLHEPWMLDDPPAAYPPPIVDHDEAVQRFRASRGG